MFFRVTNTRNKWQLPSRFSPTRTQLSLALTNDCMASPILNFWSPSKVKPIEERAARESIWKKFQPSLGTFQTLAIKIDNDLMTATNKNDPAITIFRMERINFVIVEMKPKFFYFCEIRWKLFWLRMKFWKKFFFSDPTWIVMNFFWQLNLSQLVQCR